MPRRSRRAPGGRRGAAASSTPRIWPGGIVTWKSAGASPPSDATAARAASAGGDVVGVPVEAVFAERHDHVRPAFDDRRVDVPLQHAGWQPGQHAVGVIAKHAPRRGRASAARRLELARPCGTEVVYIAPTRLAARQAEQRHVRPAGGAPCEQPAAASDSSSGWAKTASSEWPSRSRSAPLIGLRPARRCPPAPGRRRNSPPPCDRR